MKIIEIPRIKTSCGELYYGSFYFKDDKLFIDLLFQGSQLLEYTCLLFINIVNNRRFRYLIKAKKIFWRINTLPLYGSRKEMINEVLDTLIHLLISNLPNNYRI